MASAPHEGLSRTVCEAAAGLRFADIPAPVIERVKLFLIDTFGVIRAASTAPGLAPLNSRLQRWEGAGSAHILLTDRKVSPPSAALANGAAAHALDFDDASIPTAS